MVSIENTTLNLLGIYHPPYSTSQKITNLMFLDELMDHLTEWMSSFKNILIGGNFNIHIDDTEDPDAQIFNNTMEALGLQHVMFQTHQAGNILDLIFTEIISKLDIKIFKGRYISNHRGIVVELQIRLQHNIGTTVTFSNHKQVNADEFLSLLDFGKVDNWENPTSARNTYEKELKRVPDQLAPEKSKLHIKKEKRPWYDEEVAIMKRALRRSEKIWIRNSSMICWKVYQQLRKLLSVKNYGKEDKRQ